MKMVIYFKGARLMNMIEELLDKYHEDDFDKLLIEIINHMIEVKELREDDREQD